jgi:hypothetical protein
MYSVKLIKCPVQFGFFDNTSFSILWPVGGNLEENEQVCRVNKAQSVELFCKRLGEKSSYWEKVELYARTTSLFAFRQHSLVGLQNLSFMLLKSFRPAILAMPISPKHCQQVPEKIWACKFLLVTKVRLLFQDS